MLRGLKPLAAFTRERECVPDWLVRYLRMFDRHVEFGRFIKRERTERIQGYAFRRVLYALPEEEWRIDAMLRHYGEGWCWSEEGERRQGALLGYTEWEIEAWLGHLRETGILKVR